MTDLDRAKRSMGIGWFIIKLANDYAGGSYDVDYGTENAKATRNRYYESIKGQRKQLVDDFLADVLAGSTKGNRIRVESKSATPLTSLQVMALLVKIYDKIAD